MITHATISHFKSISETSISFGDLNVVVGRNGVGKSNILDALYFLRDSAVEDLDTAITKRHGIDSIRQWSKTRPYHMSIEVSLQRGKETGRYKMTLSSAGGNYKVIEESGEWYGSDIFGTNNDEIRKSCFTRNSEGEVYITSDHDDHDVKPSDSQKRVGTSDLYLTSISGSSFDTSALNIMDIGRSISDFVSYSIYPNTLRQPQIASRRDELAHDGSNLGSILKRINGGLRRKKESMIDALKILMPLVTDFRVISAGGYYVPVIKVTEPWGESHEFNMSQISDGTLRGLGILAAFYQPTAPGIIAVEEPEQMIHPGALPIIADAAKEFLRGNPNRRQVFLTTHSPSLIDLVPPEAIIGAQFESGVTKFSRISDRQLDLIKSQLFTAGEILVSEGFDA